MTSAPYPGGRFVGREHHFPLRIYFEDTDFSGLVYHANYLRYMERARSDMLKCAGIDQRAAFEAGEGVYAVSELDIKYKSPADRCSCCRSIPFARRSANASAQALDRRF